MNGFIASIAAATLATLAFHGTAGAAGLAEAWQASGFDLPESVSYDAGSNAIYVANLGTDPTSKDGNGFVSKLTPGGTVVALKWVEGLNAPKGSEIAGNKLYVTDIDELVEIDIAAGKVAGRYPARGAKFLNDLAVAADGRVFIADTFGNAIYLFENGAITEWLRDPKLMGPNGLVIEGTDLVVSSLGDLSGGAENMKPGNVKKVDLMTREISDFGTADPIGNLDGIERTGDGSVTVTDHSGGRILSVKPGEAAVEIGKLKPGSADHDYVPNLGLLLIPQMQQNTVVAYNWKP